MLPECFGMLRADLFGLPWSLGPEMLRPGKVVNFVVGDKLDREFNKILG